MKEIQKKSVIQRRHHTVTNPSTNAVITIALHQKRADCLHTKTVKQRSQPRQSRSLSTPPCRRRQGLCTQTCTETALLHPAALCSELLLASHSTSPVSSSAIIYYIMTCSAQTTRRLNQQHTLWKAK